MRTSVSLSLCWHVAGRTRVNTCTVLDCVFFDIKYSIVALGCLSETGSRQGSSKLSVCVWCKEVRREVEPYLAIFAVFVSSLSSCRRVVFVSSSPSTSSSCHLRYLRIIFMSSSYHLRRLRIIFVSSLYHLRRLYIIFISPPIPTFTISNIIHHEHSYNNHVSPKQTNNRRTGWDELWTYCIQVRFCSLWDNL